MWIKKITHKTVIFTLISFFAVSALNHNISDKISLKMYRVSYDKNEVQSMINLAWDVNATTAFRFWRYLEVPVTTILSQACFNGDYETVRVLLKKGASVNIVDGELTSPLISALDARVNSVRIMRLLLECGANPNDKMVIPPYYPMLKLVQNPTTEPTKVERDLEMFELLAQHGAKLVNENGSNILMTAASYNNIGIVKHLIENGYSGVNDQNYNGLTALMVATRHMDILEYLLSHGADKTIRNNEGKTAYDYAIERGHYESAELLRLD